MYPVFYIQLRLCLGFIKVTIVQRLCILTSTSNYQSHSFNHITIHKLLCILMYSFFRRHWLIFALPFCVVFSLLMNDAHMHKFKWHWFPKWICFKVEGVFPFFLVYKFAVLFLGIWQWLFFIWLLKFWLKLSFNFVKIMIMYNVQFLGHSVSFTVTSFRSVNLLFRIYSIFSCI